jgi:hypothetical protein
MVLPRKFIPKDRRELLPRRERARKSVDSFVAADFPSPETKKDPIRNANRIFFFGADRERKPGWKLLQFHVVANENFLSRDRHHHRR